MQYFVRITAAAIGEGRIEELLKKLLDSLWNKSDVCYGRKVWHNRNNTKRYDVWYCNHKYSKAQPCQTPFLKEDELRAAFEAAMKQAGYAECAEESWRAMIESVTVYADKCMAFRFVSGSEQEIRLE